MPKKASGPKARWTAAQKAEAQKGPKKPHRGQPARSTETAERTKRPRAERSPRWDREGQGVVGYTAHQSLRLRVHDRDRAGDVISALAGAVGDALAVDGVSLEVADPAPLLVRARDAAFADASARAAQWAGLAGRPLGPVLRVREDPAGGAAPMPKARFAAADSGVPLEGGESTVTVEVQVRFALGEP